MSDPTTTTKDVKELVRKTWCEGPLTLKVGNIPFPLKVRCNVIEQMLMSGFNRLRKRDLNSTLFGTISALWNRQPLPATMSR
jgi:hypothetical protein